MISYPNLSLDPPIKYQRISETGFGIELNERLDPDKATAGDQLSILQRGINNAYASSYRVLAEEGNNEAAHDFLGIVQLLKKNYWAGRYFCSRARYLGRNREQLDRTTERLERLRTEDDESLAALGPIYPFAHPQPATKADVLEAYQQLRDVEEGTESTLSGELRRAENNLRFTSSLLSYLTAKQPEPDASSRGSPSPEAAAVYHLLSLQPHTSAQFARTATVTDVAETPELVPSRIRAYTRAASDQYEEAGDALADAPDAVFVKHPSLVTEAYKFYKVAGNSVAANQFVSEIYDVLKQGRSLRGGVSPIMPPSIVSRAYQMIARVRNMPSILISTMSKSASTHIFDEISNKLGIPQMKILTFTNYRDARPVPQAMDRFAKGGAVCRQHFFPQDEILEAIHQHGIDKVVFHLRDPRRALISWVFYQEANLRTHSNPGKYVRGTIPEEYARTTFAEKVREQIDQFLEPSVELAEQWIEAQQENPYGIDVKITRFEDMVDDPDQFFEEIFAFYDLEQGSPFATVSTSVKRTLGNPDTHKKRGSDVDEWEEYFSPSLKREVIDAIPQSVKALYPEMGWSV
jgi:hypothetical protein